MPERILIALASRDFDPTEVALTWEILHKAGFDVRFATPDGQRGFADPLMIHGRGLDPWGWIPGLRHLRVIGLMLRADRYGRRAYAALEQDPHFLQPQRYEQLREEDYDALVLPGGHAPGMRSYLESATLQSFVATFFASQDPQGRPKPVAAVCHGVLLAARSINPGTGRSVLYGRKTTALTWKLERSAWRLGKYLARFWDPLYYRTYHESPGEAEGHWGVEQEVKRALAHDADFVDVPPDTPQHFLKTSGLVRDRLDKPQAAWVVVDANYISARWPGDVHTFAQSLITLMLARRAPHAKLN